MSNVSLVDGHIEEPKMTDEEIIKAFKVCYIDRNKDCSECPFKGEDGECMDMEDSNLLEEVGYLLDRQMAEIERLNKILENRGEICKLCEGKYTEKIKHAKSEAYKEFAHLLIDKAKKGVICAMDIPDYVKEIGG